MPDADPAARPDLRTGLLIVVTLILVGATLRALGTVVIPLVAAILIALAVMPVRDRVRSWLPGWLGWMGIVAAMTTVLLALALFFGGLYLAGRQLVGKVPEAAQQITEMMQAGGSEGEGGGEAEEDPGREGRGDDVTAAAQEGAADALGASGEGADSGDDMTSMMESEAFWDDPIGALTHSREVIQRAGDAVLGAAGGAAGTIMNSALAILASLVLVFFLTMLILVESGRWSTKLRPLLGREGKWRAIDSAEVVASKFRAYVLLDAAVGTLSALLYAVWLWFMGIDLILVWALLTFLLNFVPTLGSLVGGTLTTAYALVTTDLGTAAVVGLGILAIEQVIGNLIVPQVQGRVIALSPLVVLVALVFWAWIWGVPGALLAVPLTTAIVVIGSNVEGLRPWALLLTDRTTLEELDEVTSA
jgi:AI-2 transport protein TqsA